MRFLQPNHPSNSPRQVPAFSSSVGSSSVVVGPGELAITSAKHSGVAIELGPLITLQGR